MFPQLPPAPPSLSLTRQLAVPHPPAFNREEEKTNPERRKKRKAREEQTLGSCGADEILIRRVGSDQARGFCHRSALPRPRIRFGSSIWRRSVAGSSHRPPPLSPLSLDPSAIHKALRRSSALRRPRGRRRRRDPDASCPRWSATDA